LKTGGPGRGMATGRSFTAAGNLLATVAQEGLVRSLG
jgi:acyl-CoA thioesterase